MQACPDWKLLEEGHKEQKVLCLQTAFVAVSAYLHCEAEPGDGSTKALAATLRKRMLLARDMGLPYDGSVEADGVMTYQVNPCMT